MLVGLFMNIEIIRRDLTYLRQEKQLEENNPIEPFCVVMVNVDSSILHLVCGPEDTLQLKNLLGDSVTTQIEYIDE